MLGNYILTQTQTELGAKVNYRGSLGPDAAVRGIPILRTTSSATYTQGPFSVTGQVRYITDALLNRAWGPLDVDDNTIPRIAYLDLRGSYDLRENVTVYGAIDNVTNVAPPLVVASPSRGQTAYYFTSVLGSVYDTMGRSYRVGIRVKY